MAVIAIVTTVVGLLAIVGGVFLVFGDSFDEIQELMRPPGHSGPGGTADLGHGVRVTVPDGWEIQPSGPSTGNRTTMLRGWSSVSGHTSTKLTDGLAEICRSVTRDMASMGITGATFTGVTTVKTAGDAMSVRCEVTGTATGIFGSGPIGLRYFVARSGDGVVAVLSLSYKPGSTKEVTLRDHAAMFDSMWESLID